MIILSSKNVNGFKRITEMAQNKNRGQLSLSCFQFFGTAGWHALAYRGGKPLCHGLPLGSFLRTPLLSCYYFKVTELLSHLLCRKTQLS